MCILRSLLNSIHGSIKGVNFLVSESVSFNVASYVDIQSMAISGVGLGDLYEVSFQVTLLEFLLVFLNMSILVMAPEFLF